MITIQPIIPVLAIVSLYVVLAVFIFFTLKKLKGDKTLYRKWVIRGVYATLAVTMLFRPGVEDTRQVENFNSNLDIVFMVDTTTSMVAEDWEENSLTTRLDAVKNDIGLLVDLMPSARYSLIVFDNSGRIQVPFTRDTSALLSAVNGMTPLATRYSTGSEIRVGYPVLDKVLNDAAEDNPDRVSVVFMFTDGEETADFPSSVQAGLTAIVDAGKVYGYGSDKGGRMKIQNGYYIANETYVQNPETGEDALSIPDPENLTKIGEDLQLIYEHRSPNEPIQGLTIESGLDTVMSSSRAVNDYTWVVALLFLGVFTLEFIPTVNAYRAVKKNGEKVK
jgi:Ca-activated chloride channel family protein